MTEGDFSGEKYHRLVALLPENYERLISQECRNLALEYIRHKEDVYDETIHFTKRLTKVGSHILKSEPKQLEGLLERLYSFNIEGAEKIENGWPSASTPRKYLVMRPHFYSHGGDCARTLHDQKGDQAWAEKWYQAHLTSAEAAEGIDQRHAIHTRGISATAARRLYQQTNDPNWMKRCYEGNKRSAQLAVSIEPKHSAYSSLHAATAAQELARCQQGSLWKQRAIEGYRLFVNYPVTHPEPELENQVRRAKQEIIFLRRLLTTNPRFPCYL